MMIGSGAGSVAVTVPETSFATGLSLITVTVTVAFDGRHRPYQRMYSYSYVNEPMKPLSTSMSIVAVSTVRPNWKTALPTGNSVPLGVVDANERRTTPLVVFECITQGEHTF